MNTLIDQLVKMREHERENKHFKPTSDEAVLDTLIEYVNKKIHTEISLSQETGYTSDFPESAALFDISA